MPSRRKHRLCGTPRPCGCSECTEVGTAESSPEQRSATLPPCAIACTGDIALDAMNEATRFGDRESAARTFAAWLTTLDWTPEETAAFHRETAPIQ